VPSLSYTEEVTPISQLFTACRKREVDVIERLLRQSPAIITATDHKGHGVLHLALGCDGKVNVNKKKMLNIAAVVRLLCDRGATVNAQNRSGRCPIHYCALTINFEAAKCLLERGAQINSTDKNGRTALNYTAMDSNPNIEFVKMLVEKGAKLGDAKLPKLPPRPNEAQRSVRQLINDIREA
jgi:ankyrin repeat protein